MHTNSDLSKAHYFILTTIYKRRRLYQITLLMVLLTCCLWLESASNEENDITNAASISAPLETGLIAYYEFEGNAQDSSGFGNHGAPQNVVFTTGKFGQGAELTGEATSYVEVSHSSSLETPDAMTFSAWANVYSNRTLYSALIYKAGETPTTSGFRDRVFTFWVKSNGGIHFTSTPEGSTGQRTCDTVGGSYHHNEFAHFVGIVDAVNHVIRIYINGNKVAECTYPGDHIRGGEFPLRIGGYFHTLDNQSGLTGVIDDVRIYNRALSDGEVQWLFQFGSLPAYNTYLPLIAR